MKESEVQSRIIKNLEATGWLVTKLIQTTRNGIPDLLCIKFGRSVFIEVKSKGKKPTPLQEYRHKELRGAGVDVFTTHNPDFQL